MTKIEKAILRTLVFFNIFGRPLTLEEIRNLLYRQEASLLQVLLGLKGLERKNIIGREDEYYFLASSPKIYEEFVEKKALSLKRLNKVKTILGFISRLVPFVKNVSVINSLSFLSSNKESDIDILLVAKKSRLWFTRALFIILLEIIGQNKNKWYQADKFCLGFAFDESKLDLSRMRLKDDIYFTYWLACLVPVFDRGVYRRFIEANSWIREELPNWEPAKPKHTKIRISILEKLFLTSIGELIEKIFRLAQLRKIWRDPKNKRKGSSVIANENVMKLHPYDKRWQYYKDWKEELNNLIRP